MLIIPIFPKNFKNFMKKGNKKPRRRFATPSIDLNIQIAKLLTIHDTFLEHVALIRLIFNIPENGFTEDGHNLWYTQLFIASYEMSSEKEFHNEIRRLIDQLQEGELSPQLFDKEMEKLQLRLPHKLFGDEIKKLLTRFALGGAFFNAVEHFILTNKMGPVYANYAVIPPTGKPKFNGPSLWIYGPITSEEQQMAFADLDGLMKSHAKAGFIKYWIRRHVVGDIDESIRIYKIWKKGTHSENYESAAASAEFIAYELYDDEFDTWPAKQRKAELARIRQVLVRTKRHLKEWFPM